MQEDMNALAGVRGSTQFLRSDLLPGMRLPLIAVECVETQGPTHLLLKESHFFFPAHVDGA